MMIPAYSKKPLVYLGCALSNSPQSYKDQIEYMRGRIEEHATVLKFLGLKPHISEAFQWDINCVRRCDLLVADITYPSIGLGAEFGVALEHRKPIITLADDALALERQLAYGYLDPLHFTLRYKTKEEAAEFVIGKIKELFPGS
jgi:hypothetical protein